MMVEGWKCGECGVVYAPFINECRCSVKYQGNDQAECFHNWPEPYHPCTKCGYVTPMPTFTTVQDQTVCQHTWSESGQSTAGRYCLNCGASDPLLPTVTTAQGECKL